MRKSIVETIIISGVLAFLLGGCHSVDFDEMGAKAEPENEGNFSNIEEERANEYDKMQEYLVQEKLKEADVEKTIVYVDRPVYYPANEPLDKPKLKGKDAAKKSTGEATQVPERWTGGTMYYDFDPDFTYEVYCQPYRVTDLLLEPGEQVIEMPFLSEEKVWEIGAGVSRNGNVDTQHFFLKPAYSGLITAFIIITDKRVYHFLLKSFKDCYMTQVKFTYPNTMPFTLKTDAMKENMNRLTKETVGIDPKYLSFDYKMSYSIFKKPYWLPVRVYDDGSKTYIVMNETVLHMTSPVLFNHRNERINYYVDKTLIVIPELIEKVTMRVGREKVTIKKKNYKEPEKPAVPEKPEENVKLKDDNPKTASRETLLHSNDIYVGAKILAKEEQKEKEARLAQEKEAAALRAALQAQSSSGGTAQ